MCRIQIICFVLFTTFIQLSAQSTAIRGTVVDSARQAPIPFATVYFDGTTNGQTTDDNGKFSLALNGIKLPAILVVSHIGYRTQSLSIQDSTALLNIALTVQGQMIQTVVVQDEDQRMKNLEEFRKVFLGADDWGVRAKIQNEDALFFNRDYQTQQLRIRSKGMMKRALTMNRRGGTWSADSSSYTFEQALNLQAKAKVPLEIKLPDLGYTVQVDLVRFLSEYRAGKTSHLGHYFFKPVVSKSGKPKARHKINRQQAYYNSSLHFLRSLYAGQLNENGYQIYERVRNRSNRKTELKLFDISPYLKQVEGEQLEIRGLKDRHLAILYYGDIKGRPLPRKKWNRTQPVQSGIYIGENICRIRADGTVGESDLAFSGYIGTRGVAWILPSDYQPEASK